jgi:tetratricopeptide (TPR) repeat protein
MPDIPPDISADQLDREARAELRTLPGDLADTVARRLAAAGLDEDPARAYLHAQAARRLAARVGVVRETCGIAAYRAGEWAEALAELRAARRLTGKASYLPLMADCERALGRLDHALEIVTGPQARAVDRATAIELRIVESGIRRDQGLAEAAVAALQVPELAGKDAGPESARLFYAYADALLDAGRADEARGWFGRAAAADDDGLTDAAERFEELDPVVFDYIDLEDQDAARDAADPGADGQASGHT